MKLTFNWGTGIAAAMVIMIAGFSVMVFIATRQDFFLVEKDYYQKGINYQAQIDRVKNTESLAQKPSITLEGRTLTIQLSPWFEGQKIEGSVLLYSPVSEDFDLKKTLNPSAGLSQQIDVASAKPGRYVVKLDWTANEIPYYLEQEIRIEP